MEATATFIERANDRKKKFMQEAGSAAAGKARVAQERIAEAASLIDTAENNAEAVKKKSDISRDNLLAVDAVLNDFLESRFHNQTDNVPARTKIFIDNLYRYKARGNNANRLGERERIFVAPIVFKAVSEPGYVTMTPAGGQGETEFERDYRALFGINEHYAERVEFALAAAAQAGNLDMDTSTVRTRLEQLRNVERNRIQLQEETDREQQLQQAKEHNRKLDQELQALISYFPGNVEMQKLAKAIYGSPDEFWTYFRGILRGNKTDENGNPGNPEETLLPNGTREQAREQIKEEIKVKYLSKRMMPPSEEAQEELIDERMEQIACDEFADRCRKLVGKLYMIIDAANPSEFTQTAMQRGSYMKNPKIVSESYLIRFNALQQYEVPKDLEGFTFWRRKQIEITKRLPSTNSGTVSPEDTNLEVNDGKVKVEVPYTYLHPYFVSARIDSFARFLIYVQGNAEAEAQLRGGMRDLRAMNLADLGDRSLWRSMQKAMEGMKTTGMDNYSNLYDSDMVFFASSIWSKLNELVYARNDWISNPSINAPDQDYGTTESDELTNEYIENFYKRLEDEDRRGEEESRRATNLGIADNYAFTLNAHKYAASADPPLNPVTKKPTNQSYGFSDSKTLIPFNGFHATGRWSSQSAQQSGLIQVKLESKDIGVYFRNWDYRKLLHDQNEAATEYTIGVKPQDYQNRVVRDAKVINIAEIGSMYESGWRKSYSYEGWLVPGNVLESWKAVENIGVEAMKNFATDDIEARIDKSFYSDGSKNTRRAFVEYLYRKYYVVPEIDASEETINRNIETLFQSLELEGPDLANEVNGYAPKINRSDNYAKFYYGVYTRAVAQRMPTKYLRMEGERRKKVNSLRSRSIHAVYAMSRDQLSTDIMSEKDWRDKLAHGADKTEESYNRGLKDIIAYGESLLQYHNSKIIKKQLRINDGQLNEIEREYYDLTPETMQALWKKYNVKFDDDDNLDAARKRNALTILSANRRFVFNPEVMNGEMLPYLDEMAERYVLGHPYAPPFALGLEEFDRTLIAHRAGGMNAASRSIEEIADVDETTAKIIYTDMYSTLKTVATDGKQSYAPIVEMISKAVKTVSNMHGTEKKNRLGMWLFQKTAAFFLGTSESETLLGMMKHAGEHKSLAEHVFSGKRKAPGSKEGDDTGKVWVWRRHNLWELANALSNVEIIPFQASKATSNPTYASMYKLVKENGEVKFQTDSAGKPIERKHIVEKTDDKGVTTTKEEPWKELMGDFDSTAKATLSRFMDLPLRAEILKKIAWPVIIALLFWLGANVWGGYKAASGAKA